MPIPSKLIQPSGSLLCSCLYRKTHLTKTKEAPGSLLRAHHLGSTEKEKKEFGSREANYDVKYPLTVVWWGEFGAGVGILSYGSRSR